MSEPLDDLLPLFLDEARERLERLSELVSRIDDERAALARRELHALKGASRMMGLTEVSELCHRAEELLQNPNPDSVAETVAVVDGLADRVAALASPPREPPGPEDVPTAEAAVTEPAEHGDVRIPTPSLDDLADRAARLRVLAAAAAGLVERVFQLARLAETGVGDRAPEQVLATLATSMRQLALDFETGQRSMRRLADRQLERLLALQVQPLRPFLMGLAHHARDLARGLDKQVDVTVDAGDSQLDRRIIEALRESFLHLVRNAVDHGIELPEDRVAVGKSARGTVALHARTESDRVVIRVVDDGAGVDVDALRAKARALDPDGPGETAGANELMSLLATPGLSVRDEASAISGRGVGLDAVAATIRRVGGDLRVESEPGRGTRFVVEVPVARRGERIVTVRIGRWLLALPAAAIRRYRPWDAEDDTAGDESVRMLGDILGAAPDLEAAGVAVDCRVAGLHGRVVVGAIVGEEEVFVRRVPPGAGLTWPFEGIALLASGRPVPVISVHDLLTGRGRSERDVTARPQSEVVQVLLVDDSRVTREMLRRLLEDGGIGVTAVGNAVDALGRLRESRFDCLVTDIEMPEIDGLELTRRLRGSPELADLPVVVVSTRDRPGDRVAGLDAGADAYLTKQGLDARELVSVVQRLGSRR